ncbi:MAG: HAMP domain-containing sensor histidine kinase [Filomicrobium sp.]
MLLARTGIYGMVWLDDEFVVTARFGDLSDGIEVGDSLYVGLPILADYEDDIRALPKDAAKGFELPGVLLVQNSTDQKPRIDIHVYRFVPFEHETGQTNAAEPSQDDVQYLLLLTRAGSAAGNDLAIARMQRDRRILLEQIEQQKLELERTNKELELCNRDLEDFASIISHDLKAPMRSLRYLANDVEEALAQNNSSDARTACEALKTQTRRMSSMLIELLDYASLGRRQDIVDKTDTRALVETIVDSLPQPAGMTIEVSGTWPTLETYIAPLDLVLRNLINNAIKHHDHPDKGRITIDAIEKEPHLILTIGDDGPGIPQSRHNAIFYPFRSFHEKSAEKEPDTDASHGMGLAFVKRTLEAVGGEITVVSNAPQKRGTKFVVRWPLVATTAV